MALTTQDSCYLCLHPWKKSNQNHISLKDQVRIRTTYTMLYTSYSNSKLWSTRITQSSIRRPFYL